MDETKINSSGYDGPRKRIRQKYGTRNDYNPKYIEKRKHSGRFTLNFWAAITYGHHIPLVFIQQRTIVERVTKQDKLGMNASQYIIEVLKSYFLPFISS